MPSAVLFRLWVGLALAALLSLTGSSASFAADWTEVVHGDPNSDLVALTFDAGSVDGPALQILDTLRERRLRVTVFLTGQWVESYPELALRVAQDGHELANHSYFHPDFTRLGNEQIAWELEYTNALVEAKLGRGTRPWFRAPFGARNARVLDLAAGLGFRSIYWTLDSGDWRTDATGPGVLRRVLDLAAPGDIVVQHLAAPATAEALPEIIDGLQARGLRIATISALLGLEEPSADGS